MKRKTASITISGLFIILSSNMTFAQGVDRADINNSNPRMNTFYKNNDRVMEDKSDRRTHYKHKHQVSVQNEKRMGWDRKKYLNADYQSNEMKDVEITQSIRQELMQDGNLSVNAKNIEVNTNRGKVVVKGPVYSEEEKNMIEQIARYVAGDQNVQNKITVTN